jgi:hypothetical protein
VADLIQARARALVRHLTPEQVQDIYDAYGAVSPDQWPYSPLLDYVEERIADAFDVQGDHSTHCDSRALR